MDITPVKYNLARDFLLVEILINNANRAEVLVKMKMGELNSAVKHDDEYVIHVRRFLPHNPTRID